MSIPAELLLTDEQLGALTEEELASYQAALEAADNEWVLSDKQLYADQLAEEVDRLMYGGAAGGGKHLPVTEPVPTPSGWTTMGELRAGDLVLDENGKPCVVTVAWPVVERPESYLLTFDDGTTMKAGAEHRWLTFSAQEMSWLTKRDPEWKARRRANRPSRAKGTKSQKFTESLSARNSTNAKGAPLPTGTVRTTREIAESLRTERGRSNHAIPVTKPLDLPEADLPLDPYVLGVWLGDGTSRGGMVTMMAEDWKHVAEDFVAAGWEWNRTAEPKTWSIPGLVTTLRAMGLLANKHIPPAYLRASAEQRLALLQGLMDTDGTVARDSGSPEFCTTSRALAEGAYELIVSLGWKVRLRESRAKLNGRDCGPKWTLKWTADRVVFRLPRKAALQGLGKRRVTKFRFIVGAEPCEPEPMRCISVDSPSHLYLAGMAMVPTHNSEWALYRAWHKSMAVNGHKTLILRRVFPELRRSLIERSLEKFDQRIATYKVGEKQWVFPNGSRIEFGYLDTEDDVYQYKCFHPDHELLTESGWKPVAEVKVGERVATLNPAHRRMHFEPVSATHEYDFDGELVTANQRNGVAFAVTPNHTIWHSTERDHRLRPTRADSLPYTAKVPQTAWFFGETPEPVSFTSPGNNGRTISFGSKEWAEFLGWFIAEGCTDHGRWAIRLSQVGELGRHVLRALLDRCEVRYHEQAREFSFNNRALVEWLDENVGRGAHNKRIPREVLAWDPDWLAILLDALVEADGTWTTPGKSGHFVTASKQLADDVCEAAVKCGFRAVVTERAGSGHYSYTRSWHVYLTSPGGDTGLRTSGGSAVGRMPYAGKVYCVTVPPHGTVLTRYKGRISWSGNSAEYDLIIFDELTEFTERQFYYLASRCRTTIKKRLAGARPHVIAMTNPGSVGHAWVKRDFVDATDYGTKIIERNGISFAFVPARVSDNPYIDPDYERNLRGMAETDRKQLLEGDWDVFEGQFFAEYNREVHVIKPFAIPEDWPRIRAIDYGYAAPFCCLWIAFDNDGVGYVYRELYETQLTPRLQAERVLELSGRERIDYTVLDPSTWAQTGVGDPIAVQYRMAGLHCKKAMNARRDGWARIREYLMMRDGPHGPQPGIFFFETCSNLLRTLPMQVYDDKNVEDLDTKGEDHACFPAGTQVLTKSGNRPIESLAVGERVWTRQGWKPVEEHGLTARDAQLWRVETTHGPLVATGNHPVYVPGKGWIPLHHLTPSDTLETWTPSSSPRPVRSTTVGGTGSAGSTSNARANVSTGAYGSTTTGLSPMGITSTTPTATGRTTPSPTSPSLTHTLTSVITRRSAPRPGRRIYASGSPQDRPRTRGSRRSSGRRRLPEAGRTSRWSRWLARSAVPKSRRPSLPERGSAVVLARPEPCGHADVWNVKVADTPEFVADGFLVHNCDALRYALMSRPRRLREKKKVPTTIEERLSAYIDRKEKANRKGNHPVLGRLR